MNEILVEELNGCRVEYDLPFGVTREKGVGVFAVSGTREHATLSVEIVRDYPVQDRPGHYVSERIAVPETSLQEIELHPDQAVARFRMSR